MFCNKCGAQLEDNALFCSECGEKCTVNDASASENANNNQGANYQANNDQGANYTDSKQSPLLMQENASQEAEEPTLLPNGDSSATEEIILPKKPKKGKKLLRVFIPIVAGIAVICLIAGLFGRAVFFAVAPETYVANLIKATSDEMSKEMNQIEKNVFGFDITMDNEMTVGAKMDYKDAYYNFDFDINIANDPKESKLLFDGNYENDYGKGSGNGFIGNETAGLMLPGSDKKYLSVPTKDFGKEFESADGFMSDYMSRKGNEERERAYDIISSLDLSYDNIKNAFSSDKKNSKKINKHVADNLIKLLKKSEIGSRQKTEYEFDGKETSAYEITLTIDGKELFECYINILKSIAEDDKIEKAVDYDELIDAIEELEEQSSDSDIEISDYEIKLIEYKGKIVSVEISYTETYEYKDEDPEYYDYSHTSETENTVIFSFTNKKKLLNGIKITVLEKRTRNYKDPEEEDDSIENQLEISFASDWATKRKLWDKDKITIAILTNCEDDDSSNECTFDFIMDFEKEDWSLDIKTSHENEGDSTTGRQSYDGKCSKKDGFSFNVNEKWTDEKYEYSYNNSMSYDEWIEDEFDYYRDDYLRYVYEDMYRYEYDSYYDWYYSDSLDVWDVADSYFKDWLYDEEYYYYDSLYNAYDYKTREVEENVIPVDASVKFELTLKNDVGVDIKEGKNDNILEWSEDDFYDFGDAFLEKTRK